MTTWYRSSNEAQNVVEIGIDSNSRLVRLVFRGSTAKVEVKGSKRRRPGVLSVVGDGIQLLDCKAEYIIGTKAVFERDRECSP